MCRAAAVSKKVWSEVEDLVSFSDALPRIAELLTALADGNEGEDSHPMFMGSRVNPKDFLIRLCKHGQCSKECFIIMTILLDKASTDGGLKLTWSNIHKLILTAFVVAVKTRDDFHLTNKYYAQICGVTTQTLNTLEIEFLRAVNWEVYTSDDDFSTYAKYLSSGRRVC